VLCVEAKWDSGEGSYPASEAEKAIFQRRQLAYLTQTEVPRYLVDEVLGFTGVFAYLARTSFTAAAGRCITWANCCLHSTDRGHRASSPTGATKKSKLQAGPCLIHPNRLSQNAAGS
jgi:hypothetical protein